MILVNILEKTNFHRGIHEGISDLFYDFNGGGSPISFDDKSLMV
jgi:hypothetical protein